MAEEKVIVEGVEEGVKVAEKWLGDLFKGGEKVAKEGVEKAVGEGVAAGEKAAGEGVAAGEAAVAGEDVAAAREAAEEAAEKVAAAEAVTIESEAELEATIKAENEAVEAAEKAAEVEAGLGSRIGQKLKKYMLAALKGALELIIRLAKDAGPLLLLQVAIDEVPQEHRKELAVWAMMLAGGGNDLTLVAFLFMGLSGGSEEGKQVAKDAHDVVQSLHDHARDMSIDSPSNVPIDERQLKQVKVQREKDQKDIDKVKDFMGNLKGMLKNRQDNQPIIEEEDEEENNGSRVMNTMTLAWVGSALGAAGAEGAAAGAAEAAEAKKAAAKEAAETAKAAAEKKAATAAAAAAAAAAEAAAAEAVMVESKAGVEATVKAETEAVEVAIQAARLGRRLGARMGAVEGKKIEAGLEEAQHLLNRLTNSAWSIFLLNTKNEELPRAYRKVLAGWGMTVAAEGIKLVLVAYNYMGLSGGSKLGKMVAKNAQEMVKRLHDKARKLLLIEEEEVPINKKTHDHLMEKIQHHVDSEKQELGKLKDILDQIDDSMNKYMKDHPLLLLKTPTQHVERKAA